MNREIERVKERKEMKMKRNERQKQGIREGLIETHKWWDRVRERHRKQKRTQRKTETERDTWRYREWPRKNMLGWTDGERDEKWEKWIERWIDTWVEDR